MGLMDRVREQAAQVAQRTAQATQEAALQGKAKLDQAQAKRRADAMFRDLGAAVYAERTGRGGTDTADKIDRLVTALQFLTAKNAVPGFVRRGTRTGLRFEASDVDWAYGHGPGQEDTERKKAERSLRTHGGSSFAGMAGKMGTRPLHDHILP